MVNGDAQMNEESQMVTEEADSRITDQEHFADLPPVEVMNNVKKPKSPESQEKNDQADQEKRSLE